MNKYKVTFCFMDGSRQEMETFLKEKEVLDMGYLLNHHKKTDGLAQFGDFDEPYFVAMDKVLSVIFSIEEETIKEQQ